MHELEFRIAAELRCFLKPPLRGASFRKSVGLTDTLKHVVESLGIPHTEVGEYRLDGQLSEENATAACGTLLEVRGPSEPTAVSDARFILDGHLGRLAAYLRMLGFDCWYDRVADDVQLAAVAAREARILLTRDVGLLKRREVARGYCLRSDRSHLQLREVLRRYGLAKRLQPFQRCMECNGLLRSADKQDVIDLLPPHTKTSKDVFSRCESCGKVYWRGSHYERMEGWIRDLGLTGEAAEAKDFSERDIDVQDSESADRATKP